MHRLPIKLFLTIYSLAVAYCNADYIENNQRLAHDLQNLLFTEPVDLHANGLKLRKNYLTILEQLKEKNYENAFNCYKSYLFEKFSNPEKYGLLSSDLDPVSEGISGIGRWQGPVLKFTPKQKIIDHAEKLLDESIKIKGQNLYISGKINWLHPLKDSNEITPVNEPEKQVYSMAFANSLVSAWSITGDLKYLNKWFVILSDWVDNCNCFDKLIPCEISSSMHGFCSNGLLKFLRISAFISKTHSGRQAFPGKLLVKAINKYLKRCVLPSISYLRSNCHNWTPGTSLILTSMILDEFKVSKDIFTEAKRRCIDDNAVTQNLIDGSESQHCPWYNENYLQVYQMLRLIDARTNLTQWRERSWIKEVFNDINWRTSIHENLDKRVRYFLFNRTPQNELPIGWRGGDRRDAMGIPANTEYGSLMMISPNVFYEGETAEIYNKITRPESSRAPSLNANWFPYGGYNIVWQGWNKTSDYASLFCSPHPGSYGGYRSMRNNNFFGFSSNGQDLIVNDCTSHYHVVDSPVKVNGMNQFFHAGFYKVKVPASHKTWQVRAWEKPLNTRWHSSENFNLMEGIYSGSWSNTTNPLPVEKCFNDAVHNRKALYDREMDFWIVIDDLISDQKNTYTQTWMIPVTPSKQKVFDSKDIKVENNEIYTDSGLADKVNLSIKQFSSQALQYKKRSVKPRSKYIFGREEIDVTWQGSGKTSVISFIQSKYNGKSEVTAKDASDNRVRVLMFTSKELKSTLYYDPGAKNENIAGDLKFKAETALVKLKSGKLISAVFLNCKEAFLNGTNISSTHENFEYSFTSGRLLPIYTPVSQVKILPESNIFVEKSLITLTCDTPEVEIRYTLNGKDPDLTSQCYSKPFQINSSTVLKIKAFRKGLTKIPAGTSSTHASFTQTAVFIKKNYRQAELPNLKESNLKCEYYEGNWQDLWFFLDDQKPVAIINDASLFDISSVKNKNNGYALKYRGSIFIPEDGVYTFIAPEEYVYPEVDSGYKLDISIGSRFVPYGYRKVKAGLNLWSPLTTRHGYGTWSIALKKGGYPFECIWKDFRGNSQKLNLPGIKNYVWDGETPKVIVVTPDGEQKLLQSFFKINSKEGK